MNTFQHALTAFWRDLRAGELKLLIASVALAVAALCAVGFFAGRIEGALKRDAAQLLGGDAVVASDKPTPEAFRASAAALKLESISTVSFPSMALAAVAGNEEARLSAIKVVAPGYPLRGQLLLASPTGDKPAPGIVPAGEVWVDPQLLTELRLKRGDLIKLGAKQFLISAEIAKESDRGAGFMNFAPRVMMNQADLAATNLVQPASRVTYRFVVAGQPQAVAKFVEGVEAELKSGALRGARVESLASGNPEMRATLARAESFLRLVALLSAMLAAVAVAIAARRFAERKTDACALMRVMGAPQRFIAWSFIFEFLIVGLLASSIGVVIGYAANFVFAQLLSGLVTSSLPPPDPRFALLGFATGLTLLAAFALPPVLKLAQVPPLRVIRRDIGELKLGALAAGAAGLAGFGGLLLLMARDLKLGLIAALGFFAAWGLFVLAGYAASRAARVWAQSASLGAALVMAAKQISSRAAQTGVQVAALGIGLLALVLLFLMRTDLVSSWRKATPADAPNRFVINVLPDQAEAFKAQLEKAGVKNYDWYPMIRGRVASINGKPIKLDDFPDERAKRQLDRELNLSTALELPANNKLIEGQWFKADAAEFSMASDLATSLKLKLGDEMSFDVGGQQVTAKLSSIRKVDWGSMRANFFVILPPALMRDVATTYISAFKAPQQKEFDNQLSRSFANITVINVSASIAQVQQVLDQVTRAVEFLFVFAVICGLLVLLAALRASESERARFLAITRALGGARSMLSRALAAELALIGFLSGLLAAGAAGAIGFALAKYVFEFEWNVSPLLPLAGGAIGAVLALAAGWWQMNALLKVSVNQTLREA